MAHYYKYNFVSPDPVYAIVKEELKSYFDTGMVDDLLFPTWLTKCMQKLSKATIPIQNAALYVEDFETRLPDNFHSAREVWMCTEIPLRSYQDASSFYSQNDGSCTIQIAPIIVGGTPYGDEDNVWPEGVEGCEGCGDTCDECECGSDCLEVTPGVWKTTSIIDRMYQQMYLLKPGNISANRNCYDGYNKNWAAYGQTPGSSAIDSFDIRDNKLITNFRQGLVHLIYYGLKFDDCDNQLMPDNYRIKEYLEAFIKYKVFEMVSNQTNDETFNQIQQKLMYYKALSDEAFIMADIEVKKETIEEKARKIKKGKTRLNKYERITPSNNYSSNRRNNY